MIVTTQKVLCKETIFDEEAIVLQVEDDAAGCFLSIRNNDSDHKVKLTLEELELVYFQGRDMLIDAEKEYKNSKGKDSKK